MRAWTRIYRGVCSSKLPKQFQGILCVGDVDWVQALTQQGGSEGLTALAQAAALSVRGTHPVSQAVLACAKSAGASLPQLQDFHQQPGVLAWALHKPTSVLPCFCWENSSTLWL